MNNYVKIIVNGAICFVPAGHYVASEYYLGRNTVSYEQLVHASDVVIFGSQVIKNRDGAI